MSGIADELVSAKIDFISKTNESGKCNCTFRPGKRSRNNGSKECDGIASYAKVCFDELRCVM